MDTVYTLLIISLSLLILSLYLQVSRLEKQNINLRKNLSDLAIKTGNEDYASYVISAKDKDEIINLKKSGKKLDALKILKEKYNMRFTEAKKYIDLL